MKKFLVVAAALSGLAFTPMWPQFQNPPKFQTSDSETLWTGIMQAAPTNQSRAVAPAFDNSLPKFSIHNPEIIWTARTSNSRKTLWIYKVVPQNFPLSAISNLMVMGSFTNQITSTKQPLRFVNASNTCNLFVNPSQGCIEYWNEFAPANHWDKTNHLWEQVKGVPSQNQVEKLALKFLKQFGIQRDDLAQKSNGHLLTFGEKQTRSYFDRRRGKDIDDEIIERGIFFNRQIDGVNFAGIGLGGGCEIEFGNHANIANLKLVWRNLRPCEQRRVANPDEIISYIRDGQAVMTHKNLVNPADIKELTITDYSPLYMGVNGDDTQDLVYPFAQVEAIANLGTNNVDIQIYCPILSGK